MPHEVIVHMAVATSLAAMILMEATATYVHCRQNSVAWRLVLYFTPTIALGALTGAELAEHMQAQWLLLIIILFQVYVATYLLRINRQPEHRDVKDNRLPKKLLACPDRFWYWYFFGDPWHRWW